MKSRKGLANSSGFISEALLIPFLRMLWVMTLAVVTGVEIEGVLMVRFVKDFIGAGC